MPSISTIASHHTENRSVKCRICRSEIAKTRDCLYNFSLSRHERFDVFDELDHRPATQTDHISLVFPETAVKGVIKTTICVASHEQEPSSFMNEPVIHRSAELGFSYSVSQLRCLSCNANLGKCITILGNSSAAFLLQQSKVCISC